MQTPLEIISARSEWLLAPLKHQKDLDETLDTFKHLIQFQKPLIRSLLYKAVEWNDFAVVELLCKSEDSIKYVLYHTDGDFFAPFFLALSQSKYVIAIPMVPVITKYLDTFNVSMDLRVRFKEEFEVLFNIFCSKLKSFPQRGSFYLKPLKVLLEHAQNWINKDDIRETIKYLIAADRLEELKQLFPHGKINFISRENSHFTETPLFDLSVWIEQEHENPAILQRKLEILLYMIEGIPKNIPENLRYQLTWALEKLMNSMENMKKYPNLDQAFSIGMNCFLAYLKMGTHRKWQADLDNNPLHFSIKYEQKEATGIILSTLPFNETLLHINSEMKTPIDSNPNLFRNYVMEQAYPLYKLCTQVCSSLPKELWDRIAFLFLYFNGPLFLAIKTLEQKQIALNRTSFLKDYNAQKNINLFSKQSNHEQNLVENFCPVTLRDYLLAVFKSNRTTEDNKLLARLCHYQFINNSLIHIFKENNELLTKFKSLALCLVSGPEYVGATIKLGLNIHDFLKIHFSSNEHQKNTDSLFNLLLNKKLFEIETIPLYKNCMNYIKNFPFLNELMLPDIACIRSLETRKDYFFTHVSNLLNSIYGPHTDELGESERILIEFLKMKGLINEREHENLRMTWEGEHKLCKLN